MLDVLADGSRGFYAWYHAARNNPEYFRGLTEEELAIIQKYPDDCTEEDHDFLNEVLDSILSGHYEDTLVLQTESGDILGTLSHQLWEEFLNENIDYDGY